MHKFLKLFIFTSLFLTTTICSDAAIEQEDADLLTKQTLILQQLNESSYNKAMDQVWDQYNEEFNYSSSILDEYVTKNISSREAFSSTISLFVLNKETLNAIMLIRPPQEYSEKHNISIYAMVNLEDFLWNMAKYYETEKKIYAIQARGKFNESIYYYGQIRNSSSSEAKPTDSKLESPGE
jgi:hypothetical protein